MRALTPWTGLSTMKKEMDRLFDRFWEGDFPQLPSMGEWAPALDVSETKDAVMVKAEVPGMDPKEIQLSLQDQLLTLKGEKKQEKEEKDEHYYRAERSYGAFVRAVRLPAIGRRIEGHGQLQERASHGDLAEGPHRERQHHSDQGRVGRDPGGVDGMTVAGAGGGSWLFIVMRGRTPPAILSVPTAKNK